MIHERKNVGTHATMTKVELDDNLTIVNLEIVGGCAGNTRGVMALAKGMNALEAIKRLKGIPCGDRGTSCPDQAAIAIEEAVALMKR